MGIVTILIICALVFGVCFLIDKGFTKLFRSQAQHFSGKAVRLNRRYGSIGLLIAVVGLIGLFMGLPEDWVLIVGGALVVLMGIGLVVYYMGYGVFYDENSFLFMTLGKQTKTYYYNAIRAQQLYNNQGHLLIELHMSDGNVIQLQSTMNGCYEFMDHAFAAWLKQTGKKKEDCPYYDPDNSCWFPPVNEEK
jgi:hypothetical protein